MIIFIKNVVKNTYQKTFKVFLINKKKIFDKNKQFFTLKTKMFFVGNQEIARN